jgi:hypothetical protein
VKPRIRECAKFGNLNSVEKWGHGHAEAWNLELAVVRTSEDGRFGNLWRTQFGSHAQNMHEPMKKQRPIRESVEDPVRGLRVKTFTNLRRGKVKVVPKSPGLECELVADL